MKRGRPRRIVETLARADIGAQPRQRGSQGARNLTEADLSRAIDRAELMLHFQPIVDLRSGECRRLEALLRWRHPRLGILLPGEFMPLAISSGLLEPIGRWVIDAAKSQWLEWKSKGDALGVSVNVTGPEIADASTLADMLGLVRPFDPDALTIEMTPRAFAEYPTLRVVGQRLAAAGARIALDDVGVGDAPGRSVAADFDELKLSRSLVARAAREAVALADLRALIELGRDYRLTVVAVGVENQDSYELVASLGCDLAQGYWVSRPLGADRLAPWRRLAVGVAFGGALAIAAHVGASRAAAGGGSSGIQLPVTTRGFLPSMCCLDLPTTLRATEPALELLHQRTGATFAHERSGRAEIFTEQSISASARRNITTAVDRDMAELEATFGREFSGAPTVYVFATRNSFALGLQEMFGVRGPDAGLLAAANGGITLPRQGAIVINLQNVPSDGGVAIVRHELTHALVHEMVGLQATLPAWFDEGVATVEEQGAASDETTTRRAAIVLSILSDGRASLTDLNDPAHWAQRNATLNGQAYAVSAEAARLLQQRVGHEGLVRILDATGRGDTFGAAYAREAGESVTDFERAFAARLASEQEEPRIIQVPGADGVRWTVAGFRRSTPLTVTIEAPGYKVEYEATTDRYGMYQAVFGRTAPQGEYTVRARAPGTQATTVIRT